MKLCGFFKIGKLTKKRNLTDKPEILLYIIVNMNFKHKLTECHAYELWWIREKDNLSEYIISVTLCDYQSSIK